MLQILCLIRPKAGIGHEQYVVMNLLGVPFVMVVEGLARVLACCLVKLLVFGRAEPRAMHDLALSPVGRRQVGQMGEPAVTDGGLENQPERDDLVVKGAAGRSLGFARLVVHAGCHAVHPIFLHLARRDFG